MVACDVAILCDSYDFMTCAGVIVQSFFYASEKVKRCFLGKGG